MNIKRIRLLAKAERMMDSGEIPWVWSVGLRGEYERLSVSPEVMEILELEQGQTVNSFIVDAIAELSFEILKSRIEQCRQDAEDKLQEIQDEQLTEDFDFRSMM